MTFELPELGYGYDALEPYIDARTMEIHHSKHHKGYTDKFNKALEGHDDLSKKKAEEIIADLDSVPQDIRTAVRNNGGGYVNHKFFWQILKKDVNFSGSVAEAITKKWGSFEKFKDEFSNAAMTVFGSGWAWLVVDNKELEIISTPNQDSPLSQGKTPILGIDMWEHAFYILRQNRKNEYVESFFNVINWSQVEKNYQNALR